MKKNILLVLFSCFILPLLAQIKVDNTKTYLTTNDGKPFFWLADTGWELFHRLSREEIINYLHTRKKQEFNVIMAVALAEVNGIKQPNFYGHTPFKNIETLEWDVTSGNDPKKVQEYDYWDHLDFAIKEAERRKMYVGLLPSWGDKVVPGAAGPVIFTNEKTAYDYAKKLANRYKNQKNIIWILGGDRPALYVRTENGIAKDSVDYRPVWRGMAKAIQEVFGKEVFIAYHPGYHTSEYFKDEDSWLSINAIQSGHATRDIAIWDSVRVDLKSVPKRPFMDMEPCYEDHPVFPWDGKWTREGRGYFSDYDVRARIYRSVFAGSCGAVYGHHQVWQFLDESRNPPIWVGDTIIGWQKAIHSKGAYQMKHIKKLIESRKDFRRTEDSLLVVSNRGSDYRDIIIATKQINGNYALIYIPQPNAISVDLDRLKDGRKKVSWFNPVTGKTKKVRDHYNGGIKTFSPPNTKQKDWVLVIDVIKSY